MHYVGRHGENVFEDREVEFTVGDAVISNVIEGLDIAVKRMKEGEKCRLDIKPSMAYGSKGNPDLGVPPDAELVYDVELLSFENVGNHDNSQLTKLVHVLLFQFFKWSFQV